MPDDEDAQFEWEGRVEAKQITGALLELAALTFAQARQTKAGKNSLTAREMAEVLQQTVQWANARFPDLHVRLKA